MGRTLPAAIAFLISASVAHAQEDSSWIGRRVVTRYQTPLKVGDYRSSDYVDQKIFLVYKVKVARDGWLWLASGSQQGWAHSSDVIPFDRAIDYYTEEIRLDPNSLKDYLGRGIIWYEKKEYDKAIADYSEVIRLKPGDVAAFMDRGNAWRAKGEYDKAIADYNEAIRLDPKCATAFDNRGIVWGYKGEHARAIADHSEAIRLDPKYALAFNNRGVAWRDVDEFGKALSDYDEAIRLDPQYMSPFSNRAWIMATCPVAKYRDGRKAIESATRACELTGWNDASCLDALAAAYAEAGDFAKAVESEDRAITLCADDREKQMGEEWLALYKAGKPYRDERKQ